MKNYLCVSVKIIIIQHLFHLGSSYLQVRIKSYYIIIIRASDLKREMMNSFKLLAQWTETRAFSINYEKIFLISPQERFDFFAANRIGGIFQTKNKEKRGRCFTIVYHERDASLDLMNSLDADGRGGMEVI